MVRDLDIVAVGALLVAVLSLLVAVGGYCVARKALKMSEADHKDKYKDVVGYLIKCFKWMDGSEVYAAFAISYTNKSSSPNSFKSIVLEVEYYDAKRVFNKVNISPDTVALPASFRGEYEELKAPVNLSAKETVSGWITFKLPKVEGVKFHVDVYRVVAVSAAERVTAIESYVMALVKNGEKI